MAWNLAEIPQIPCNDRSVSRNMIRRDTRDFRLPHTLFWCQYRDLRNSLTTCGRGCQVETDIMVYLKTESMVGLPVSR
jgi:hypothetical protein